MQGGGRDGKQVSITGFFATKEQADRVKRQAEESAAAQEKAEREKEAKRRRLARERDREAQQAEAARAEEQAEREQAARQAVEEATAAEAAAEAARLNAEASERRARAAACAPEQRQGQAQKGVKPDDGNPGRSGYLSFSVKPIKEDRYDEPYRFSLYASVLVPKPSKSKSKSHPWRTETIAKTFTSREATLELRQQEAESHLHSLIWKVLKPFMADHVPATRRAATRVEPIFTCEYDLRDRDNSHQEAGGPSKPRGIGPGRCPVELDWRLGLPSGNSASYRNERTYTSVQEAMLAHARERIQKLKLQIAQQEAALRVSEGTRKQLRCDLHRLTEWALSCSASSSTGDTDCMPQPHQLPEVLGSGYSVSERARTFYRDYHEFMDSLLETTGGDVLKARQLFDYANEKLSIATAASSQDERRLAETDAAIVASLCEFFGKAYEKQGNGRPIKKLAQGMQSVLTAIAHAPELGSISLARVASRCGLGRHGSSRLKAAIPHADRFIDEGFIEAIFDERCKKRSDAIPDEQITWLVNECWLSNKYTRESEKKKDEVFDPKSRQKDREHHRLRWLEVPLCGPEGFYESVKQDGIERWGDSFHMSSTFIREHRPWWAALSPLPSSRSCHSNRMHMHIDLAV